MAQDGPSTLHFYPVLSSPSVARLYSVPLGKICVLPSFQESTVTLIHKPYKDQTKKENYRPISSINTGGKILGKVIAN